MPVRAEDVTVTEGDVTESLRLVNLRRVDKFLQSASEDEAKAIRGWAEHRLMALGAIQPEQQEQKSRKRDRVLSRMAAESVPLLITLLFVAPVVIFGVLVIMYTYFRGYNYSCPPTCSRESLILWAVVGALGLMVIVLVNHFLRKLMMLARK